MSSRKKPTVTPRAAIHEPSLEESTPVSPEGQSHASTTSTSTARASTRGRNWVDADSLKLVEAYKVVMSRKEGLYFYSRC
jgi:hypothetical protein